jgi:hypothetical protein
MVMATSTFSASTCLIIIVHDGKDDGEMMAARRFLRSDKDAEGRDGRGRGKCQ